jgi:excinuclease ABC subunit C
MGYVTPEEYKKQIDQIIMLLEGKIGSIIKSMETEMQEYSNNMEYEKAALIRDRISAIQRITEKQTVSNISENNIDVIGLYKNDVSVCIEIFFVRGSKMVGREHYFFNELHDMEPEEIVSGFIKQYYMDKSDFPNKIMLRYELEDKAIIEKWLSEKNGKKVTLKSPQKGEKLHFVEMAEMNSKITLENRLKDKTEILTELRDVLELEHMPLKIESFDISNISGSYIVAGMVVAINGELKKNMYRRFKIKTVLGQDDPQCTKEVVSRRIKHSIENPKGGFGTLPNLILADGGITQIKAIKEALNENSVDIPVFGMVKDDHHSTRALINEFRDEFQISDNLFNWITNMQNEVHKTAIEYHRKLRDKGMTKSKLDDIQGIGEKKRTALLKKFKTVKNIKEATIEELCSVSGINQDLAQKLKNEL